MLTGASSRAPKWSVVGLIGYGTAWSRGSSSRPPPDTTAEMTASARKPAKPVGSRSSTSKARELSPAPGV